MKWTILLVCWAMLSAAAQDIPSATEQIAAAVKAAPAEFRADATVLGYDGDGRLVTLREGGNRMICLADDPTRKGFSVAAYHDALEPFMARGRQLRAEGKTSGEIFDIRETEVRSGTLSMPEGGSTLHILYGPEGYYDAGSDSVHNAIYRYVVYLPWATTETTGLPAKPTVTGGPWIMDPGTHKAHIMISPPQGKGE